VHDVPIRDATIGDAPALARLVTVLGYPTTAPDMSLRLGVILERSDYATFVAEADAAIVGMAGAMRGYFYEKNGCYVRLVVLVVDPASRGARIGEALVRSVERWAKTQDVSEIVVNSRTDRDRAHRFYERLGYRNTGLRFVKSV
jgi:GNAT superfamily N-acetyltransferase